MVFFLKLLLYNLIFYIEEVKKLGNTYFNNIFID